MKKVYIVAMTITAAGREVIAIQSKECRLYKDLKKYVNTNTDRKSVV